MKDPFNQKRKSRIHELPDTLDDDPTELNSENQSTSENQVEGGPDFSAESPPQKDAEMGGDSVEENAAVSSFEFDSEEPATDEEIERKNKRGDESDMEGKFGRFAKAVDLDSKEIQKEAYALEKRLQELDFGEKKTISLWMCPITKEIIDVVADQLGVDISEVVHAAMLLFYRSVMQDERRMLHDLGFLLDNLALQNQELAMETSALEDLAQQAIELEASPYFSPDEDTLKEMDDFDYEKEREGRGE